MKVVLQKNHKKLGLKGEIVDVADGFAMSSLVPQGIAVVATPSKNHQVERTAQNKKKARKEGENIARIHADKLAHELISISAKAEGDKLFGSISAREVASAIKAQYNIEIDEKNILLSEPLREVTQKEIQLDLGHGVKTQVTIEVIPA